MDWLARQRGFRFAWHPASNTRNHPAPGVTSGMTEPSPHTAMAAVEAQCRARITQLQRASVHYTRLDQVYAFQRMLEVEELSKLLKAALAGLPAAYLAENAMLVTLTEEVAGLRAAIRRHRDRTTGQGMCWENDRELWTALGEVDPVDHRPPGWLSFLWNCVRYRWSRRGCCRGVAGACPPKE